MLSEGQQRNLGVTLEKLLGVLEVLSPDLSGHEAQQSPPGHHQVDPRPARGGRRRLERARAVMGVISDWPSSQANLQRHGFWT